MKTIVHISGASGAGKTTIGQHFASLGLRVIDTDDINDKHALAMLEKGKYDRSAIKRADTKQFAKIINESDEPIIIVGRIIDLTSVLKMVKKYKFYGFYLNVDADTIFRRANLRHLSLIKKHANEMEALLRSDTKPEIISHICLHRFELRRIFLLHLDTIKEGIKMDKEKRKKEGYKILSAEKIIDAVAKILAKN